MRDIKFRGKRIDNGEWVYGYYRMQFWMCGEGVEEAAMIQVSDGSKEHKVYPETLGQFTGRHDNEGKEIYEGDIFMNKYGTGIIIYDNISCAFKMSWFKSDLDCDTSWFPNGIKTLVVIGNIHDNIELIK